jgi:hypothetical protein
MVVMMWLEVLTSEALEVVGGLPCSPDGQDA